MNPVYFILKLVTNASGAQWRPFIMSSVSWVRARVRTFIAIMDLRSWR